MSINLGESFLAGLRAPYYANGRLLTAEDLQADQEATHGRLGLLGQAVGAGVVRGFEVSQVANNLRVAAGLGINRRGQAVSLVEPSVELSLAVLPTGSAANQDGGRFNDCQIAPAGGGALVQSGAYLLAAAPVSQLQGSVAVKTISAATTTCASRWEVEGVQFKAIRLANAPARNADNAARYRNLLAHWCFGTEALQRVTQRPFTFPARYSGLDLLTGADLGECDLPLAVFYWDGRVLTGVDQWAARRPVTPPFPAEAWHALVAGRRLADAQARFLQFQDQIDDMVRDGKNFPDLTAVNGRDVFRWLPPLGFLPVAYTPEFLEQLVRTLANEQQRELDKEEFRIILQFLLAYRPTGRAFRLDSFFGAKLPYYLQMADRPTIIQRLHSAWHYPALDFDDLPELQTPGPTPLSVHVIADGLIPLVVSLIQLVDREEVRAIIPALTSIPVADRGGRPTPNLASAVRPGVVDPLTEVRRLVPGVTLSEVTPLELSALTTIITFRTLPPPIGMFGTVDGPERWLDTSRGRD